MQTHARSPGNWQYYSSVDHFHLQAAVSVFILVSYKCPPNPPAQTVTLSYKFQLNQRTEIASIQTHFCSRFKGTHGSRNPAGKRPTNTRTRTKPPNPMRGSIKFCHDERRKWLWPGSNPVGQAGKQLIIDHRLPQFDMICCWCQETLVGLGLQLGMLAHAHDTVITSLSVVPMFHPRAAAHSLSQSFTAPVTVPLDSSCWVEYRTGKRKRGAATDRLYGYTLLYPSYTSLVDLSYCGGN